MQASNCRQLKYRQNIKNIFIFIKGLIRPGQNWREDENQENLAGTKSVWTKIWKISTLPISGNCTLSIEVLFHINRNLEVSGNVLSLCRVLDQGLTDAGVRRLSFLALNNCEVSFVPKSPGRIGVRLLCSADLCLRPHLCLAFLSCSPHSLAGLSREYCLIKSPVHKSLLQGLLLGNLT